ncbi:hypothetical protein PSUM_29290 [Pseudomonas umsongensis]|jgi:hypothetical protein|uniref:Uncharacterized protein n=1 Tax=Pseudomonas umsongensis TaxID=198618 RepID=A0ABX4DN34_9PSED|nr:hypothetical protein PSUM_29290 [Pseudomonas umsongensis]
MDGSPSDQAERSRAVGGPWNWEVEVNFLNDCVTSQKIKWIDMFAPSGKSPPCNAKVLAGFRGAIFEHD